MCECYQIGGPFIAEDPDCPIHGRDNIQRKYEIAVETLKDIAKIHPQDGPNPFYIHGLAEYALKNIGEL